MELFAQSCEGIVLRAGAQRVAEGRRQRVAHHHRRSQDHRGRPRVCPQVSNSTRVV